MWRQSTEDLLTLERSELADLLLRCARETDASICRFTTQFGESFRVGEYTSPPEHVRLNVKFRAALDALLDAGFVTQSGDRFALTNAGYEAAEEPRDVAIPSDAAPILDLLLRAGLCVPRFFEGSLAALPAIERDEMHDAQLGGHPARAAHVGVGSDAR